MTATFIPARTRPWPIQRPAAEAALLVVGLGAITAARLAATRAGLDALAVGAAFGVALVALALVAGVRRNHGARLEARPRLEAGRARLEARLARHVVLGAAFGLALVLVTVAGATIAGGAQVPGLSRPAAPFLPWAAITIVVAVGEEAALRRVLFDRLRTLGGPLVALALTSIAFALMHVPLYGWHVVPLDLAVGVGLGGLRIVTRGIAAPAAAHAVADLATWWL